MKLVLDKNFEIGIKKKKILGIYKDIFLIFYLPYIFNFFIKQLINHPFYLHHLFLLLCI
jgi:hypothetical protein